MVVGLSLWPLPTPRLWARSELFPRLAPKTGREFPMKGYRDRPEPGPQSGPPLSYLGFRNGVSWPDPATAIRKGHPGMSKSKT